MAMLEHWKQFLQIDKNDLDLCLVEQPEVYYHVSEELVKANAHRDAAKLELEELQAQKDKEIRENALKLEEKLTETAIQNKLRTLPVIKEAQADFLEKRQTADQWSALKEAFSQRSFMLRELVALVIAQRHDLAMEGGSGQARGNLATSNREEAGKIRRRVIKG